MSHIHMCGEDESSASPSMRAPASRDVAPRLLVTAALVTEQSQAAPRNGEPSGRVRAS